MSAMYQRTVEGERGFNFQLDIFIGSRIFGREKDVTVFLMAFIFTFESVSRFCFT